MVDFYFLSTSIDENGLEVSRTYLIFKPSSQLLFVCSRCPAFDAPQIIYLKPFNFLVMSNAVKIYQHTNFRGKSVNLHEGEYPRIPSRVGNDKISSIRIAEGFYARFYVHSGYRGGSIVLFPGDYRNLPNWNDKISSIRVFTYNHKFFPIVEFFQNSNF